MADEDLIFRLEGVGGQTPRAGRDGASDTDSEDEDGYFICPITDEPRSHQLVSAKANARYGDLMRREQYGSSGSPAGSFSFKEAWKHAIEKAKHMPDPWAEFHLEDIATERATRHRSAARPGAPNGPRPPGVLGGGGAPSPRRHGAPGTLGDRAGAG